MLVNVRAFIKIIKTTKKLPIGLNFTFFKTNAVGATAQTPHFY